MSHVLVVGGTGMLRGVTLELVRRGHAVSLIARRQERLEALQRLAPGSLNPVALDYRDTTALKQALQQASEQFGPIVLAVVWIHSVAPEAPYTVAEYAEGDYYHLLSSAATDPSQPNPERQRRFASFEKVAYHEVILGFMPRASGPCWLSDEEISKGVLEALERAQARFVVGHVEPWSARP